MAPRYLLVCLVLVLTACGSGNTARFLVEPPIAEKKVRLPVSSIEVREIVLPAYAASPEIVAENADGSVRNVPDSLWADDPAKGLTSALARSLDLGSTASVAAEPWPLDTPANAQLDVRVDRILARADGRFELSGQFAIYSREGVIGESLTRFDIQVPFQSNEPRDVAATTGIAIAELAKQVLARLAR
jgi:uncharacterized lipoprotein YmbA